MTQPEAVQLQSLILAAKLLVLAPPTSTSSSSIGALGQVPSSSSPAHKIALLARYIFAQAARVPLLSTTTTTITTVPATKSSIATALSVRDRARTLGSLLRGVDPELFRASVLSEKDVAEITRTIASASNSELRARGLGFGVNGHGREEEEGDEYEVSAEDWERAAARAQNDNEEAEKLEGDSRGVGGGVTLRVEQVRVVLFEGVSFANVSGTRSVYDDGFPIFSG